VEAEEDVARKRRMSINERKCEEMGRVEIPQGQLAGPAVCNTGLILVMFRC
jgi:hypothetical protein